jgi:hypothetical protein
MGGFRRSLILLSMVAALTSCRKPSNVAAGSEAPKTFASPEEAGTVLLQEAKSGDQNSLLAIFGPDKNQILFSGDSGTDKNALKDFATAYETMHRWGKIDSGGQMLYVGADNFPFPVPLEKNSNGQWYFNSDKGADEVLARHIGKDELVAMAAIGAIGNAEQQYYEKHHQYAQKFVSDEGKQNGLYWPASKGQDESPLARMGDFAKGAGYTTPGEQRRPFYGYLFRILNKQGRPANGDGFTILAYPAEYGDSGIMTFVIGPDGVVYQKDLGDQTDNAASMTEYNPADGWEPANP